MKNEENSGNTALAIILVAPVAIFLFYLLTWSDAIRNVFGFGDKGSTGDYFAGIASPIIGYLSAILIYLTFRQQIRANQIQIEALEKEVSARKEESRRANTKSNLDQFRTELNGLFYKSNIDDRREFSGMQAYEMIIKHIVRVNSIAVENNENVLDTIYSIMVLTGKMLEEIDDDSENRNSGESKSIIEDIFYFYSLKMAKGINSLANVNGINTVDMIKQTREAIRIIFRSYGYNV